MVFVVVRVESCSSYAVVSSLPCSTRKLELKFSVQLSMLSLSRMSMLCHETKPAVSLCSSKEHHGPRQSATQSRERITFTPNPRWANMKHDRMNGCSLDLNVIKTSGTPTELLISFKAKIELFVFFGASYNFIKAKAGEHTDKLLFGVGVRGGKRCFSLDLSEKFAQVFDSDNIELLA
jgi:hypothetical protein